MDRSDAARGGALLLAATAVAGGLGYVMQPLAAVQLGAADYARFAVAWAAVFGIAGALAGVQQEVARSASPAEARRPRPVTVVLGVAVLPMLAVLLLALLPSAGATPWVAVALAAPASAALLVVTGFAYAAHAWRTIAIAMVLEAVLRLVLLQLSLSLSLPLPLVVLALIAPFALTAVIVAPAVRRAAIGHGLGGDGARFAANVSRTLVATTATAIVVSAFPVFIEASAQAAPTAELGAFLFAFTLTRAPFVIVFLALQSFLIKLFQAHLDRVGRRLLMALAALVLLVAVAAAIVAIVGPGLLRLVGAAFVVDGWTLLWIVLSAAPMSALAVSGPLVLAAGLRSAYAAGWVLAAVVAIGGVLAVPGDLVHVALIAISAGPTLGAVLHLVAFARR